MQLPHVATSHSALDAFETCPREYNATSIAKTHKKSGSQAMETGKAVHKAMEDYVKLGVWPPPGLTKLKKLADRILVPGYTNVTTEEPINLNYMLQPCGPFDDNVVWRAKLDLNVYRPGGVFAVDWKTSSEPREDWSQLKENAMCIFQKYAWVDTVVGIYGYTQHRDRRIIIARDEVPEIVDGLTPRLERLKLARETGNFPPKPGWKCKTCPVSNCEFNRRK